VSAPRRTRIKFCGVTRRSDVDSAVALGVDALGLIFAARSPRRLELPRARELRAAVPPFVSVVALVMDAEPAALRAIVDQVRPQLLQYHGSEAPEDCTRAGVPFLKVVPMAIPEGAAIYASRYPDAAGYVFDSHGAGEPGGSGRRFDWSQLPRTLKRPLILAGGLTPDNVFDAVRSVRPWAVDVSSGIESEPGLKDEVRMRRFVEAVREADATQRDATQ
jgi:phosphoribosylanthranilate isomerase